MRVLASFAGGTGHLLPLLPFVAAVRSAGHAVAVAGRASALAELRDLTVFPEGSASTSSRAVTPLLELDPEREDRDLRVGFAERIAREHASSVWKLIGQWAPDVVVCDEVDFGAMIAAERAGLPYAVVLVLATGGFIRAEVVGDSLDAVRAEHGLPPDPELAMLCRHLVLSPFPPGLRDPAVPLPPAAQCFRPEPGKSPPAWLDALPDRPTVYFSLGTAFNSESGDLFSRVLAGLAALPVTVVATVGRDLDPAALGAQPPNVRLERYLPQASVLPRCDAVVSHGGSGTVLDTLAAGLPSVLLPMGADQPLNAARCAALGVGITLDAVRATSETIGAAVLQVLDDPGYRAAAAGLRAQIAALPPPAAAVPLLDELAAGSR